MVDNKVKAGARQGQRVRGVHLTSPSHSLIESMARCRLDFVYLDGEHGCFAGHDIEVACIAAERHGITVIARIPDPSPATISRFLDRGVKGIVVPHVDNVEQAQAVVEAAYFRPLGQRSYGGLRGYAMHSDIPAFLEQCNESTSVSIMIETEGALRSAHDIAALQGVDYMSFGMVDLAQALGYPGQPRHPKVQAAVSECQGRVRGAGKPIREDFMKFAWMHDVLAAGVQHLLGD
jgi:2-keto-3-deoxy-L-rhamnonate aldolase RhmA